MTAILTPILSHCVDVFLFWFVWQLCDAARTKGLPILKAKIETFKSAGGSVRLGGTAELS